MDPARVNTQGFTVLTINCGKSESKESVPVSSTPAPDADDASFKDVATDALIEASKVWTAKNVSIGVETDIPYKIRIPALKVIQESAENQDLLLEIQRLGIQTIQLSSANFAYRNAATGNAVTVTWKFDQDADAMIAYLRTVASIP
ncbi:MAG TPA: hypothetical protein VE954_07075 [Oligoflexus sp.]|uniref:hypothetical protein n=1 Tax=Oligoflexus sp. TaxID=1971216 RepID=UPI002D492D39|nr:hypothetical protein [Oligoflexus sp.]HYX32859.1 hypothetical protein [Oligoflexus sp.]